MTTEWAHTLHEPLNTHREPSDRRRTIVKSSGETYFPTKFHHFGAKYFSSFRNFPGRILDTVTTEFDETSANLINITWRMPEK